MIILTKTSLCDWLWFEIEAADNLLDYYRMPMWEYEKEVYLAVGRRNKDYKLPLNMEIL